MMDLFDTPLRSAALGVLIVLSIVLLRGVVFGRPYKPASVVLSVLALAMIVASESLQ
ncbi:MAG: hypothetical protein AAF479_16485 [Pseudomonadota bacterium]